MKKFSVVLGAAAVAVGVAAPIVNAEQPPATTFVVVLTAADEVPHCDPSTNASRGVATFHVVDEATGTVEYQLIANNLPGDIVAAHIHLAPAGTAGIVRTVPLGGNGVAVGAPRRVVGVGLAGGRLGAPPSGRDGRAGGRAGRDGARGGGGRAARPLGGQALRDRNTSRNATAPGKAWT